MSKSRDAKTQKEIRDLLLVGTDAIALYPNLRREESANIVASEFLRSELKVKTEWKEVAT